MPRSVLLAQARRASHAPGPARDLMHAIHASHDVKWRRLRGRDARKIKESGRTGYLGVKGSQVQILSARP